METKLTELLASNDAIDVIASALRALPGGAEALEEALLSVTVDEIATIVP